MFLTIAACRAPDLVPLTSLTNLTASLVDSRARWASMAAARKPSSAAIISSRPRTTGSRLSHSLRSRPTSSARRSARRLIQRVRNARSLTMQIAAACARLTSESIRWTAWLSRSSSALGTPHPRSPGGPAWWPASRRRRRRSSGCRRARCGRRQRSGGCRPVGHTAFFTSNQDGREPISAIHRVGVGLHHPSRLALVQHAWRSWLAWKASRDHGLHRRGIALVTVTERQAEVVVSVIRSTLAELGTDPDDGDGRTIVQRNLRAVGA